MSDADTADDQGSKRVERQRSNLSPEQEIAASRAALERKTKENTTLAGAADKATATAAEYGKEGAAAIRAQVADAERAIANGISAQEAKRDAAQVAWKSAREAGDVDAEQKANDMLTDAKVELRVLSGQKATFDANKPHQLKKAEAMEKGPPAVARPSAESQKWLDDHPEFETNPQYRADALDAHELAIAKGIPNGSTAYVTFLDSHMARLHGKEHGRGGSKADDAGDGGVNRHSTSSGAPPSRDTAGGLSATVDGYNLRIIVGQDGKEKLVGDIPPAWREGAKWSGMNEVDYSISQLKIQAETKAGKGPVLMGEGAIYR